MPGGDRTGPWGAGPLTGRRLGVCATETSADAPVGYGRGFLRRGMGGWGMRGGGLGHRRQFYAMGRPRWARFGYDGALTPPTPQEAAVGLRHQAAALRAELAAVEQQLAASERQGEE